MVDWKGLLNWSLKYQDGTKPSNFSPMSEEDKKFVQEAFESVCVNEMKEIWKILDTLKTPEGDSEKEIEDRGEILEALSSYLDGPENSRNMVRGKRFNELVQYFFNSKHKAVTISTGRILATMMQNDDYIQTAAMNNGIFKILSLLNESTDGDLTNIYIYIMTGIIYGDCVAVREEFVKNGNGIIFLYNMLIKQKKNLKGYKRILNIFADLSKIVDSETAKDGVVKLREETIEKMREIKMGDVFMDLLKNTDFSSFDNVNVCHCVYEDIISVTELGMDKLNEVANEVKIINKKIKESTCGNEEDKKEENTILLNFYKRFKARREELINNKDKANDQKENNIESKMIGNKESIKIELKK